MDAPVRRSEWLDDGQKHRVSSLGSNLSPQGCFLTATSQNLAGLVVANFFFPLKKKAVSYVFLLTKA